ncbi:hypothetical protein [Streptococcus criceti]|uniref:hypothetical protein n=1 Tax=Streptococcus criceti TaxID=1333 RepID=UPI0012FD6D7F|nr:hypothetical protein [Streptococcus criceti]
MQTEHAYVAAKIDYFSLSLSINDATSNFLIFFETLLKDFASSFSLLHFYEKFRFIHFLNYPHFVTIRTAAINATAVAGSGKKVSLCRKSLHFPTLARRLDFPLGHAIKEKLASHCFWLNEWEIQPIPLSFLRNCIHKFKFLASAGKSLGKKYSSLLFL